MGGAASTCPEPGSADYAETCPEAVHAAALEYVAAGLNVIPVSTDSSKSHNWRRLPRAWDEAEGRTKASWKVFQMRRPRQEGMDASLDVGAGTGSA